MNTQIIHSTQLLGYSVCPKYSRLSVTTVNRKCFSYFHQAQLNLCHPRLADTDPTHRVVVKVVDTLKLGNLDSDPGF